MSVDMTIVVGPDLGSGIPERAMPQAPAPEEIVTARLAAALTQSQCADMVHLSHPIRWSDYERGRQTMDSARWELFLIKTGNHQMYRPVRGVPAPRRAIKE